MSNYEVIDAKYTIITPGRSRDEVRRKRRRQFWAATIQALALAAGLMAITACLTALLLGVL